MMRIPSRLKQRATSKMLLKHNAPWGIQQHCLERLQAVVPINKTTGSLRRNSVISSTILLKNFTLNHFIFKSQKHCLKMSQCEQDTMQQKSAEYKQKGKCKMSSCFCSKGMYNARRKCIILAICEMVQVHKDWPGKVTK